jgi:D-cysteine desulfhydrase
VADLAARLGLPRVPLLDGLVAVERIDQVGAKGELWVKREDRCGRPYGGNKVRKLELLLGAAQHHDRGIITFGAAGSHHALAAAIFGRQVGVPVHVFLCPQLDTPHARRQLARTAATATSTTAWEHPLQAVWLAARRSAVTGRAPSKGPMWVGPGGSSPLGVVGSMGLGLELAQDVHAGRMPAPDRVVVPLGSGGTAAGLALGLALGGLSAEVVAVRVVPWLLAGPLSLRVLVARARALLRREGLLVPSPVPIRVRGDQYGDGYGHPSAAGEAATVIAAAHGLTLEPTYSAKAFAAALDEAERPGRTLFVATASSIPDPNEPPPIPDGLERLLRGR